MYVDERTMKAFKSINGPSTSNGKIVMKTAILIPAIVAALSMPIASAQDKSVPAKPAMGMDMDNHMGKMQGNMKAMQAQMDKIHKTTDPKERQKLMQAHMTAM